MKNNYLTFDNFFVGQLLSIKKAVVPSIVYKDFGYIGMFAKSLDRPYLDNHFFLMYKSNTTHGFWYIDKILQKLPEFYSRYYIEHDGVSYVVFVFVCFNKKIKVLLDDIILPLDETEEFVINNKSRGICLDTSA